MPARTLPPSPDPAALSPPRFHPRSPSTRRDGYDAPDYAFYAPAMPAQLVRPDAAAPPAPLDVPHRVYPDPASIPPHWQVHPASLSLSHFRDARPLAPPAQPTAAQQPPWARAYPAPAYVYPRVMPGQPFVAPPPPPIPHKVWILDCKSCRTFLTNRGMKAVLLLRPNVPLYSTDALPINCSAFSPPSEVPSHPPASAGASSSAAARPSPPSSARSSVSGPSEPATPAATAPSPERPPSRTCECLTQTLCCHGCGGAVGYMIVSPCTRCTSSITANNRATNGHRFVFYSSEIVASERHYVAGERGVSVFHPPAPAAHPAGTQGVQTAMAGLRIGTATPPRSTAALQGYPSPTSPTSPTMPSLVSSPAGPPVGRAGRRTSVDYLADAAPASPASSGNLSPSALAARSRTASSTTNVSGPSVPQGRRSEEAPPAPPNSHSTSPHPGSTDPSLGPGPARARAASTSAALAYAPTRAPPVPVQERLKAGEVLYWHHLLRSGEIPAVVEDPRARLDTDGQRAEDAKCAEAARRRTAVRRVVAGR